MPKITPTYPLYRTLPYPLSASSASSTTWSSEGSGEQYLKARVLREGPRENSTQPLPKGQIFLYNAFSKKNKKYELEAELTDFLLNSNNKEFIEKMKKEINIKSPWDYKVLIEDFIFKAIGYNRPVILLALIIHFSEIATENKVNRSPQEVTPLMLAVIRKDLLLVAILLKAHEGGLYKLKINSRIKINAEVREGKTVLQIAAYFGMYHITEMILEAKKKMEQKLMKQSNSLRKWDLRK